MPRIIPFPDHSVETAWGTVSKIWESCFPTKKIINESPYFIPDLNKPVVKTTKKVFRSKFLLLLIPF